MAVATTISSSTAMLVGAHGIASRLAKRRTPHASGLGTTRWVVECTLTWLRRFRRLAERPPYVQRVLARYIGLRPRLTERATMWG